MKTWGSQCASQNRKSIPWSLPLRNPPLATWTADPDCPRTVWSPRRELLVLVMVGHFLTFMLSRSGGPCPVLKRGLSLGLPGDPWLGVLRTLQ